MKVSIKTEKDVEVEYLAVNAEVRYWEDATINGEEDDEDDPQVPCREGDQWRPIIRLSDGKIMNWPKHVVADIHYKVCDAGIYTLLDKDNQEVIEKDGYVPAMLSPGGSGYGDYIIMKIDENGFIENWKANLEYFMD